MQDTIDELRVDLSQTANHRKCVYIYMSVYAQSRNKTLIFGGDNHGLKLELLRCRFRSFKLTHTAM